MNAIENVETTYNETIEEKEEKKKMYIPLENRSVNLPEIGNIEQENKFKKLYNEIEGQIAKDIQIDNHIRKEENRNIMNMKRILKQKDMILITTDKTKKIITISNQHYREAGLKFLEDKTNYRKLEKGHSIEIEKKRII